MPRLSHMFVFGEYPNQENLLFRRRRPIFAYLHFYYSNVKALSLSRSPVAVIRATLKPEVDCIEKLKFEQKEVTTLLYLHIYDSSRALQGS